jgi:hypothetical protein
MCGVLSCIPPPPPLFFFNGESLMKHKGGMEMTPPPMANRAGFDPRPSHLHEGRAVISPCVSTPLSFISIIPIGTETDSAEWRLTVQSDSLALFYAREEVNARVPVVDVALVHRDIKLAYGGGCRI